MQDLSQSYDQKKYELFCVLRDQVEQERTTEITHRIHVNPSPTTQESILGAFIEMYEPHLRPIMYHLLEKGYVMDQSSGFCGKYYESQALYGLFPTEDIIVNKLAKIGVKLQKHHEFKSLKFWPDSPDLDSIAAKHMQIATILPPQQAVQPSQTFNAQQFRMTYIPKDPKLKKQRLFEILMFEILHHREKAVKKRITHNPHPDDIEYTLGTFREMLEPQVKNAVLEFNRKGYSTDISGFLGQAESQLIEGDFSLEESTKRNLESIGIAVETNPSGYTKLQFFPEEADIEHITATWDLAASLLPDKGKPSFPSMTKTSRNFRKVY